MHEFGYLKTQIQKFFAALHRCGKRPNTALRDDLLGQAGNDFELREKYIGKLFDLVDCLTTLKRSF